MLSKKLEETLTNWDQMSLTEWVKTGNRYVTLRKEIKLNAHGERFFSA